MKLSASLYLWLAARTIAAIAADASESKPTGRSTVGQLSPIAQINGTWLCDDASYYGHCELYDVWESKLKISDGKFTLSRFFDLPADLIGHFVLDPANPKNVDLQLEAHDLHSATEAIEKLLAEKR